MKPSASRASRCRGTIVPDIPPAAIAAAESAIRDAFPGEFGKPGMPEPDALARAALEAAAPILAGEIAQKITEYAAEHEPDARTAEEMMRRSAWRGHFHTAAHIALGRPLCANCALPVMPLAASSTGWTHDSGSPVEGWQGVRCPGRLCGATPVREDEGS